MIASSGGSGTSSGSVKPAVPTIPAANFSASSSSSNPVRSMSKSASLSSVSSIARRESSHSDASWERLSMIRYALTCAGVKPSATWTGTFSIPSCSAARYRVCPTTMTISLSTTIGCRQPNSFKEAATLATAASFFLGLRAYGITA